MQPNEKQLTFISLFFQQVYNLCHGHDRQVDAQICFLLSLLPTQDGTIEMSQLINQPSENSYLVMGSRDPPARLAGGMSPAVIPMRHTIESRHPPRQRQTLDSNNNPRHIYRKEDHSAQ